MCLMYLPWNKLTYDFNHIAFVFIVRQRPCTEGVIQSRGPVQGGQGSPWTDRHTKLERLPFRNFDGERLKSVGGTWKHSTTASFI